MDEFRATLERLGVAGDVLMVRVHRRSESDLDELAGRRPRYFAVCTLVRDRDDPAVAEVKGFLIRERVGLATTAAVVRVIEDAMRDDGFSGYWFEREGGRGTRVIRRTL